jgi:Salmonella virulence plasmid 28.1kDa A protein
MWPTSPSATPQASIAKRLAILNDGVSMTISPCITSTENLYEMHGALSNLGYSSVFDVVRIPRERFVRQHQDTLGKQAGPMYDLMIGYAHQVAAQFRHNGAAREVNIAAQGPFSVSGPDYANQFFPASDPGWKDKAPSGAPEVNDGPVAYLAHIYSLALSEETANQPHGPNTNRLMNPLNTRRPDIPNLVVDDAAINKEIPQIQLVNEVLASAIQAAQKLGGVEDVNKLLATTRVPNSLPYNYANQQICVVESELNICLFDCLLPQDIALLQGFWSPQTALTFSQAGDLARLQIMASQLAPEQQKIVTEPAYFGHYHLTLSDLYDPQDETKHWQGFSMTDVVIHAINTRGAFTLPLQEVVGDYAQRPANLVRDTSSAAQGKSPLEIILSNAQSAHATVTFQSWHDRYNDGLKINIYQDDWNVKDVPCMSYSPTDNKSLVLSEGPWFAQFALNFSMPQGDLDNRDLTISVYLSSDNNARYTDAQKQFYQENFGNVLGVDAFYSMGTLTSLTGLTVPDVEKMLCATAGGEKAFTVVKSENFIPRNGMYGSGNTYYATAALPFLFGARFIHAGLGPCIYLQKGSDESLQVASLTDDRLDRINRMVRLQKWLELPFPDVDLLVTSTIAAEGSGNPALLMNDNTLRMVGVFKHYQKVHGVSAQQFAAWLYLITPFAITPERPFLDQVFNSTGAFDTPLEVDHEVFNYSSTSGADSVYVQKICAALGLNRQDFVRFAKEVAKYDPYSGVDDDGYVHCDLPAVSSFYRFASLARALDMSPADFFVLVQLMDQGTNTILTQLAGMPIVSAPAEGAPLASDFLTLLMAFSNISQWLQDRKLSIPIVVAMATPPQSSVQGTAYQLAVIQEVWQQLPNTLVDSTLFQRSGAPLVDDNQTPIDWLTLLSAGNSPLIDGDGLVTDEADNAASVLNSIVSNVKNLTGDEKTQAVASLTAAVLQARQTQTGVATSLLAKTLDVAQSLSALLLEWAQQSPWKWLKSTWELKATVKTPADIPAAYLNSLQEIARRALVCQQFSLSPAAVQHLLAHPDHFGLPSPYGGDVAFETLYILGRYDDLLHQVGDSKGGTEDDVLAYLQQANINPPPTDADAAGLLAALLGWEQEEVQASWAVLGGVIGKTVPQIDAVMRLQQAQQDTGLTVSQQQQAFVLDRNSDYDAWQAVGQAMVAGANHVKDVN